MTTMTLPSIAEDVARRVDIKDTIDRLNGELALIDERLRTSGFGTHDAGDWSVSIRHNRRLDTARLEQRYPVAQYPAYYKPVIDTSAVREHFAPIELEQFMVDGAPIVSVK